MADLEVVFFGNEWSKGDLRDVFQNLQRHSKDANHPILARFIVEATRALRLEIADLSGEVQVQIPPFDTVIQWPEMIPFREGPLCGAVEGVLLVVAQIGAYIGYVERNPQALQGFATTSIAGLGVGLLASTVAALSANPNQMPLVGADAVALAFRMGVLVQEVSENLDARDPSADPETWAFVVHNVDATAAQAELDDAQPSDGIPETSKIFISAYSPTSITVSGPPTRLKAIFHTIPFFRDATSIPLPVYGGLCHAPHVYNDQHVDSILAAQSRPLHALAERLQPVMPLYSTSTGKPYCVETASDLFASVLRELLTRPISWHLVVDAIEGTSNGSQNFTLRNFGNSLPFNDLFTSLRVSRRDSDVVVSNLSDWIDSVESVESRPTGRAQDKLAIVGMSCRLPNGATSTEKFWDLLEEGIDVSRKIPADRFDIDAHYDPTGKELNKTQTQYGCFIDDPGLFDAPFFNMSPREAQVTDPQMRLALVTAYEALERAGYVGNRTFSTKLERIGTYYGQAADDYREVNQGQEVSTYYIPGGCRAFGPGRINYFFKFAGPSYSIDTACSSGLASIEVACQALWAGNVDTAVAGGVNVLTNPDGFSGLCNGHFLTKGHNACKTWDANADGYCRADAVGTVIIKRLEDAEVDNDNILGLVCGAGTNHSANAVSITHPHAGHQAYLARQTLSKACLDPLDVSYVELHGTGTQAGDHHEMEGILNVYAPLIGQRSKDQPLHIGAVKANVGHSESAAGTTALLKVLLMLQKNAIPQHIGIKTDINPKFPDLKRRNVHIPFATTPWLPRPGKKRRVAINNFGAAGGNTTMLLEEAPERSGTPPDLRQTHVISVTAKTKTSLKGNIDRLLDYLEKHEDVDMASLSYTTTARRYQHTYRVATASSSISDLRRQLGTASQNVDLVQPVGKSGTPSIAFTFTGQGAATKSMDLELYRDSPFFRRQIQHLDNLARSQGFPSFIPALDGSFPSDHLHSPTVTQLALVCLEIALAKYWSSLGIKPDLVIGHSLGEYAAMYVAGVTSISDTISLVGRRAQLLERRCEIGSHAMMAVRASLDQIRENSENKAFTVACINGPMDTVLAGTKQQMDEVANPLEAAGFRCIKLDVAFAFHSEQTDPILDDFEAVAKGITFQDPRMPFISPLLGKVIFDSSKLNANYVRRATRETVNFLDGLTNARDIGTVDESTIWLELGPHPICTSFVKSTLPSTGVAASSMRRGENNWKSVAESLGALHLAGVEVNWNEFHRPFESGLRLLDLPTYTFNEKNYWFQYNGDWCLTKGNNFYEVTGAKAQPNLATHTTHEIQTSTVQQVVEETFHGSSGTIGVVSDLMQPEFLAAAHGHRMNNCGVVTSSIHADIAFTLGAYLVRRLLPKDKSCEMNVSNLVVTKGLVARKDTGLAQLIRITAHTDDINSHVAELTWQTVDDDGRLSEAFATASILYENPTQWLSSWESLTHLVHSRIADLDLLALQGKASRFSRNMAYGLFASNLVDYADKYRGMQSVVMHGLEAYANVELTTSESGRWTLPPYFIDSVAHLAGFVMNCSDAMDTKKNYCVTPGWQSMRFAEPLLAGHRYRSYVKMIPTKPDPSIYLGDVYIMREGGDQEIIGMVGGIQFRRYPRVLLDRFFSPPDQTSTRDHSAGQSVQTNPSSSNLPQTSTKQSINEKMPESSETPLPMNMPSTTPGPVKSKATSAEPTEDKQTPAGDASGSSQSTSAKALLLVANEAGLDPNDLEDDASFADLGVDSLMSLVISEKLRTEIGVKVGGSFFLDYPTVGEMRIWLDEAYG